jgi:hypothetical protein
MSSEEGQHWFATASRIAIGPVPASALLPVPILPFWHPYWFMGLSATWIIMCVVLHRKGLGADGFFVILRRALQGRTLKPTREIIPKQSRRT